MPRWIAIGTNAGWADFATFQTALKATPCWRIDNKTTITAAFALEGGRALVECHAQDKAVFLKWMDTVGFAPDEVSEAVHVARGGDVWKLRKP